MAPTFNVRINGEWVPVGTLPAAEQAKIKRRVAAVLQEALTQQVAIMTAGETNKRS